MERAVRRRSVRALRRLLAPRPRSGRRAPVPMLRPRRIWTVAAIALLVLSEVQLVAGASSVPAAANPIAAENQKPGRPLQSPAAFQSLKNTFSHGETRFPNSTPSGAAGLAPDAGVVGGVWTASPISGYAGADSINKGGAIDLYVSTTAPSFSMEVYRVGYYGGAGSR